MVRSHAGQIQFTERDQRALTWVGDQWVVRVDHLQRVLGGRTDNQIYPLSTKAVEQVVIRWKRAGWVEARKFLAKQPSWIWLTRAGLEAVGLPYREWVPKLPGLAHLHAVNGARLWIEAEDLKAGRVETWVSERYLRYRQGQHGFTLGGRPHLVDAELLHGPSRIAIEVELTPKTRQRTVDVMQQLVGSYRGTFYFVTDATKGVVCEAWQELGRPVNVRIQEGWGC
jgi:hypothetical protein